MLCNSPAVSTTTDALCIIIQLHTVWTLSVFLYVDFVSDVSMDGDLQTCFLLAGETNCSSLNSRVAELTRHRCVKYVVSHLTTWATANVKLTAITGGL